MVDALGNPTGFALSPGQAHDLEGADALLPDLAADALIADKAFDAEERVLQPLARAGKTAVIPPKANRKEPAPYDKDLYKARHLIENFFAKLKQYRAIATRYDKRAVNFLAAIYLAASRHLAQLRTRPSCGCGPTSSPLADPGHHRPQPLADLLDRVLGRRRRIALKLTWPALFSSTQSRAKRPSWMSASTRFISALVSSVMIRGPVL